MIDITVGAAIAFGLIALVAWASPGNPVPTIMMGVVCGIGLAMLIHGRS